VQSQKVLVVEDDPVTLLTLKDRLEYEGFDVETERWSINLRERN